MRTAALVTSLALGAVLIPTNAEAAIPLRSACRFQFSDGHEGWSVDEARRTIICVFDRLAPGQTSEALAIAERESGYHADAVNHRTDAEGLFQHLARYWPGRVRAFGRQSWFPWSWPNVPILSARANAIITARYVNEYGWAAWSA